MTKGRPAIKAVEKALGLAAARGPVHDISYCSRLPYHFQIMAATCTIFVKVKRTRANIDSPADLLHFCRTVIRGLRAIPASAVTALELWVLTPHGVWQFFRIAGETITEIRQDGSVIPGTATAGV
ncbi:MAG: hypothetical protein WCX22_06730 [Methanoregula sp.]